MPRYVFFTWLGKHRWGQVSEDGRVHPVSGPPLRGEIPMPEAGVAQAPRLEDVALLPPSTPTKLVCVGRNYRAHARELGNEVPGEPLLFLKPPSALLGAGGAIEYPVGQSELVHHEGELAAIIGTPARHVDAATALDHVAGYTLMNDVTARDLQRRDSQFTRGKGFDTFAPLGPWLDTDFRPAAQGLTVRVNGELRQDGRLSQMIFGVGEVIAYVSRVMTLMPGDVIATGTPSGVGPLVPGDEVSVTIEGLGTLANPVVAPS